MKIKQFKGPVYVFKLFFILLFPILGGMAASDKAFSRDLDRRDLLKGEAGHGDHENIDTDPREWGINGYGGNENILADVPFRKEISQNDKGEEPTDNEAEKVDGEEEQIDAAGKAPRIDLEPIQYCQGKFKRLGGTGVEIITIRCPIADDSCNCEGEKKSPTKWVECGGVRKDSTIGSDLLSCESKIVGSGAAPNSQ